MVERYGSNTGNWTYGSMSGATFRHQVWSTIPEVAPYVNREIVVPGNHNTVHIAESGLSTAYEGRTPAF